MQHIPEPMRHIPEAELHAYLDQALSRSQCVEIEHHLAGCRACRAERDGIAALRDRTTALLVAAAPRRIRPRPFAHLSTAHSERTSRRARGLRTATWAASLVAAIGLGWSLNQWSAGANTGPGATAGTVAQMQPPESSVNVPAEGRTRAAAPSRTNSPTRLAAAPTPPKPIIVPARFEPAPTDTPVADPPRPATTELASLGGTSAASEPVLPGVWRTVAWTNSQAEREEWVPRVDGVPVVQVKQRQGPQGGRPITLVTQLLANGEMISTVEGPATEVAALLSQQPGQSASAELQDMEIAAPREITPGVRPSAAPGSAPRTLAIFGSAPPDSLKAFMLRVK
jgi:hypothetical protein